MNLQKKIIIILGVIIIIFTSYFIYNEVISNVNENNSEILLNPLEEDLKIIKAPEIEESDVFDDELLSENLALKGSLILNTDKNIYERTDQVFFTVKNDSNREIFSTWSGILVGFHITFEKYDEDKNEWGVSRHFFENSVSSLNPGESVNFNKRLIKEIPINDVKSKFRIKVEYLDHEKCKYPDYMEDAAIHLFCSEQAKIIYSNEFIVNAPIQAALDFCMNRKNNEQSQNNFIVLAASNPTETSYVGPAFYLNFEGSEKKDIVGTCDPDGWGGYGVLFVLVYKDGKYEPFLVEESIPAQRSFDFADLKIEDIDQDGFDEIIYVGNAWAGYFVDRWVYLYSPSVNEWFFVKERESLDETRRDLPQFPCKVEITYSDNLNNDKNKEYKDYLKIDERDNCILLDR